jgi:hypothetical protein
MKSIPIAFLCVAFACPSPAASQTTPRIITGQIVDSASGHPLVGAYVLLDSTADGGVSDSTGAFRFTSRYTTHSRTLRIRRIGHRQHTIQLEPAVAIDSIVVGRVALVAQPIELWGDGFPECQELKGKARVLRKDSIVEWVQDARDRKRQVIQLLCHVRLPNAPPDSEPSHQM